MYDFFMICDKRQKRLFQNIVNGCKMDYINPDMKLVYLNDMVVRDLRKKE